MAESDQIYRESCRRLHRIAANFFAVKTWCAGADCVIIDRSVLERVLELERIRDIRVEWIREDVAQWFPHIASLTYKERDAVGSLYLSRYPIGQWMSEFMTDRQRAELLHEQGIKCLMLETPGDQDWSASRLLTELTLLAAGLSTP